MDGLGSIGIEVSSMANCLFRLGEPDNEVPAEISRKLWFREGVPRSGARSGAPMRMSTTSATRELQELRGLFLKRSGRNAGLFCCAFCCGSVMMGCPAFFNASWMMLTG